MKKILVLLMLLLSLTPLFSSSEIISDNFDIVFKKEADTTFSFDNQFRILFQKNAEETLLDSSVKVLWDIQLDSPYKLEIIATDKRENITSSSLEETYCLVSDKDSNNGLNYNMKINSIEDSVNGLTYPNRETNISGKVEGSDYNMTYQKLPRKDRLLEIISGSSPNKGSANISLTIPWPDQPNGIYQGYLALILTYQG